MGAQETRLDPTRRNRRQLKQPSPAAEQRTGDVWRARLGLILVVVVFLVAGMLLYTRLAALRAATTPVAAGRVGRGGRRYPGGWERSALALGQWAGPA